MFGGSEARARRSSGQEQPTETTDDDMAPRESWRELAPWRETALFHYTTPHSRRLLEDLGVALAETAAEKFAIAELQESCLRAEIRAALCDLRYLKGFLAQVGASAKASDLSAEDLREAAAARRFAHQISRISRRIEEHLEREAKAV